MNACTCRDFGVAAGLFGAHVRRGAQHRTRGLCRPTGVTDFALRAVVVGAMEADVADQTAENAGPVTDEPRRCIATNRPVAETEDPSARSKIARAHGVWSSNHAANATSFTFVRS